MKRTNEKPVCSYSRECYRKNEDHREKFYHPPQIESPSHRSEEHVKKKAKIDGSRSFKQTKLNFLRGPITQAAKEPLQIGTMKNTHKGHTPPKKESPGDKKSRRSCEPSDDDSDATGDVTSHSWTFQRSPIMEAEEEGPTITEGKSDTDSESDDEASFEGTTVEEKIKYLFLVSMPKDFYDFYSFCKTIDEKNPNGALKQYGLTLVGAFDVLSGKLNPGDVPRRKALCHWRFFMDPPEMQTVLIGQEGQHFGYWRDDPAAEETFIVANTVPECRILPSAVTLFGVALTHIEGYIRTCSPFEKVKATKVLTTLKQYAEERGHDVGESNKFMVQRKKKVVAATFHGFGIVVDVQPKTDLGYRPLYESYANIKKTCKAIMKIDDAEERKDLMETIDNLVNAATIANDECDFGNGLELGINLFCMGSDIFHKSIKYLLVTCYNLLNRPEWALIIKSHLKYRRTSMELSVIPKR